MDMTTNTSYSNIGYNLKVTDMQAAIGVAQLKKIAGIHKETEGELRLPDEIDLEA